MQFNLIFEFPHYNSVEKLPKRINGINHFLEKHLAEPCNFRRFGIELFPPNFSVAGCKKRSVQKFARNPGHSGHYILGFFFFKSQFEEVGNLTILVDLGENLDQSVANDVMALSAIASSKLDSVKFIDAGDSIMVNINGNDTNNFLIKHLTYTLNGKEFPDT